MMKNRRQGPCCVCGNIVAPMQGVLEGPPWQVKCSLCAGAYEAPRIEVGREGGKAVFSIKGHLGDRFNAYRKAITGATYDGGRRVNLAVMDKVPAMINALKAEGFIVDIAPALIDAVQKVSAKLTQDIASAEERAEAIDTVLRERGLRLYPFQREGVAWLASRMAGLLADEMGLGKTIQTLIAIPENAPSIVVCPSVAKSVWMREAAKWRPDIKVTVLSGLNSFRWPEPGEMIVLNYDILPTWKTPKPKVFTQPFPLRTRDSVLQVEEPFKAGVETVLQFEHRRYEDEGVCVTVEVSEKVTKPEWHVAAMWDETAAPDQRKLVLGEEWCSADKIIAVNEEVQARAAQAVDRMRSVDADLPKPTHVTLKPKLIRIQWSTTKRAYFGVHVERKLPPPPPPPPEQGLEGTVVIADEGHAVKNSKAQRTERFRELTARVREHAGRVWLLTATPLLNKATELWTILQSAGLGPEAFGNWDQYADIFGGYRGDFGYEWGTPDRDRAAAGLRKVSLRRMRKEVLPDLPTKTYQEIVVPIDSKSKAACDEADAEMASLLGNDWTMLEGDVTPEKIDAARARIARMPGTSFKQMSRARAVLATAKIPSLLELVEQFEEQEEPIVVFSAHRAPIDMLGKREGWATITGDTDKDPEVRKKIEDDFQAGKLKGIACTIKAGGVAITLTRASFAIFVDRDFTPALNAQAEDRICRIGQTRGCIIIVLKAEHPLDRRQEILLGAKTNIIDLSVDASTTMHAPAPALLPEVDFDTLAAEAAEEARKADEAKATAAARVREFTEARTRMREAILAGQIPDAELPPEIENAPMRRGPRSSKDVWAARALIVLAGLDPDHAATRNDVGFNSADGPLGHSLAQQVEIGLTEKQWDLAAAMCTKYWRQIGRPPELV